jgi:hypothetical protein
MLIIRTSLLIASALALSRQTSLGQESNSSAGVSKPWLAEAYAMPAGSGLVEDDHELLRAIDFSLASTWLYDSNVNQANDRTLPAEGDWIWSLAPSLSWGRKARDFEAKADVKVNYDQYLEMDDYSALDYQAGAELIYRGGPLTLEGGIRQSHVEGVDRYGGGLTELDSLVFAFSGGYKLSPKTSLLAEFTADRSESEQQTGTRAERETSKDVLLLAALWKATPLLELGPGFRAMTASSDGDGDRDAFGPALKANYRLSGKVKLKSRVGLDFVEYQEGGSEEFVNAALGLEYQLDPLWNFTLSANRDSEPETSAGGGFRESTALRFGVKRKIHTATLGFGVGYESSEFSGGTAAAFRPGIDFLDIDTSLMVPFYGDRGRGRLFFRYQDSSSDDLNRDWDGFQSGVSFSYQL